MSPHAARIDGLSRMRCLVHRASPAGHDRPLLLASIAGSDYRQSAKPVVTVNTENPTEGRRTYNRWRLNRRSIASRSVGNDANPIPGGSTFRRSQTSAKTPPKIPKIPKIKIGPHPVSETAKCRNAGWVIEVKGASADCANALIGKSVEKSASDGGPCLPSGIAPIAAMSRACESIACISAGGTSKTRSVNRAH